jgi:antitoxin component YwqK of YwqJK toxin-antitoxin module
MKKISVVFLLLQISFYSYAQQIEEVGSYENGEKTGKWTTYVDGKVKKVEHFKNGNLNGDEIFYYENGQIKSKGNYTDDEPDGEHISYYENGKVETIEHYTEGKEHGQFLSFFENGKIEATANFKEGAPDGEFIVYDKQGELLSKGTFRDGEKVGVWLETEEIRGGLGTPETIQVKTKDYTTNEESIKIYLKHSGKLDRTEFYKDDELVETKYQSDVEFNENKFKSKENLVAFLNKNIIRATIDYYGIIKFSSVGEINYEKSSLKFIVDDDKIYLHTFLPESLDCKDNNKERLALLAPQSGTDNSTYFYLAFDNEFECSERTFEKVYVYFKILPEYDINKIKQYFKDQEEKYYRVHFQNKCPNDVSLLVRILNDEDEWETKGWYTVKSKESLHIVDTKNAVVYYYAQSGDLLWKGDNERDFEGKTYEFAKWEIKDAKGIVGLAFDCD